MAEKKWKIVDCICDDNDIYETLAEYETLEQAEHMLCYFLNHDHDAYIEYPDGEA